LSTSTDPTGSPNNAAILAGSAGVGYKPASARDPLLRFFELMEVVQLLCPRWPPRAPGMRGEFRI